MKELNIKYMSVYWSKTELYKAFYQVLGIGKNRKGNL